MLKKAKDVDAYISQAPSAERRKLRQLREAICVTAPGSVEKISYGMPYYDYKGRLAYFALAKTHIGLYIPTPVMEKHRKELKAYSWAKATVRFPLDKDLPLGLVKKLIKARMKMNGKKSKL